MTEKTGTRAGAATAWIGAAVVVVANLALGWITLLPAAFVVLFVSVSVFDEISTDYSSDPGFYRAAAIGSAALIALLFVAMNAAIQFVVSGRSWLWLLALAVYPVPYLVDLWSSR